MAAGGSDDHYVWLIWSSAFLAPWLLAYVSFPRHRQTMIRSSLATMPFGLTEPLFVPRYWNPPSLFDLAQRTGFDIESMIFCFAIGGIGATLYNVITNQDLRPLPRSHRRSARHRYHLPALLVPVVTFPLAVLFPWNPIYPAILAMALGAVATMMCRPDLLTKTWVGAVLFFAYYAAFMLALRWAAPGYIERVWNLEDLSGMTIYGIPLEELLFGLCFGLYWAGIYEHFTWKRIAPRSL